MKALTPMFVVSALLLWAAAFTLPYSQGAAIALGVGALACFALYARGQKR
jgi:hypothetical protein